MEDNSKILEKFITSELDGLTDHELELLVELESSPPFAILVNKIFNSIEEKLKLAALIDVPEGTKALIKHGHRQGQVTNMQFIRGIGSMAKRKLDKNKQKNNNK